MYTFKQTWAGYRNIWDAAKLTNPAAAKAVAQKIIANRDKLQPVEDETDVPWWVVGAWLYRESDLNFDTMLANGQSLHRVTTEVPAGLGPYSTFAEGAIAAIKYEHKEKGGYYYKVGRQTWNLEYILWATEAWNGQGYFSHGNSPYVWNWTNQYTSGKFVADHDYSATFKDPQGGCAAIFMELFELDPTLKPPRYQEKPMTDPATATTDSPKTTAPPAVNVLPPHLHVDFAKIEATVEVLGKFLPIVGNFVPQVQQLLPFVAILEDGLKMADELNKSDNSPAANAAILSSHLHNAATNIEKLFNLPNLNLPGVEPGKVQDLLKQLAGQTQASTT